MLYRLTWTATLILGSTIGFVIWIMLTTPNAADIKGCLQTSLYQVWLCEGNENPNYRRLAEISPYLKNLVLISEDASFYGHNGFDWAELKNSFERNLAAGRAARGGSTITQQLAKNVFLNSDKTLLRKAREALLTVQIETILTKDKIFEKYLNVIEFAPNIYGAEAAAHFYFRKSAQSLNLLEAAYLTHLIPNPKIYYRTFLKSELTPFSKSRITDLCYRLMKTKRISEDQYQAAKASLNFFPWYSLPAELLARLGSASTQTDIHDAIDESTLAPSGTNDRPPENSAADPALGSEIDQAVDPGVEPTIDATQLDQPTDGDAQTAPEPTPSPSPSSPFEP